MTLAPMPPASNEQRPSLSPPFQFFFILSACVEPPPSFCLQVMVAGTPAVVLVPVSGRRPSSLQSQPSVMVSMDNPQHAQPGPWHQHTGAGAAVVVMHQATGGAPVVQQHCPQPAAPRAEASNSFVAGASVVAAPVAAQVAGPVVAPSAPPAVGVPEEWADQVGGGGVPG